MLGLFGFSVLTAGSLAAGPPVAAATIAATTTCSNGVDNAGGLGLICEVTIVNTITATGGSAAVTVRECHGAAGDPEALCTTDVQILTEPVTSVNQCNDAGNGGGATVRCSVQVTNHFVSADPNEVAVSVNQCVGSGDGETTGCDPFPATTPGATVTQCNGSANGLTLVELTCDVTGTESAAFPFTINQCNGSGNGGGGLVICSANVDTTFQTAAPSSPVGPTTPPTDMVAAPTSGRADGSWAYAVLVAALAAGVALIAASDKRRRTVEA
jgi:hypothetical protein